MNERLPEITRLASLLEALRGVRPTPSSLVLTTLNEQLAVLGFDREIALLELMRTIDGLERIIPDIHSAAARRLAERLIKRVQRLFSAENLVLETKTFLSQQRQQMEFVLENLELFDELKFDAASLPGAAPGLLAELEALKGRVAKSGELADASRVLVLAQLDLMGRSINRFDRTGVGPFRDSLFSIYGRIVVELQGEDKNDKEAAREIVDDVLRVINLVQAAGGALALSGPVIAGLLAGPSAGG